MTRAYGTGSVRQLTDGKYAGQWVAEWELPRGEDGRRRRRRVVRKTENEARRAMRAEVGKSSTSRRGGERLDDFLDRWLTEVVAVKRRERTLIGYRQIADNHLIPAFGARPITDITRRDVQKWVSGMTAHPTTIRHVVACLRAAYASAVKWELVAANPVTELDLPAEEKRIVRAMTFEDAKAILAAVEGTPLERLVTVALWTGMRQGELLGLRWSEVDLRGATVTVAASLSRLPARNATEGTRYVLTEPKSKKSIRSIPLMPAALEALRAEKKAQMGEGTAHRAGLVFHRDADRPLDGTEVTHDFQAIIAKAGLPPMTFHELRHGCATLLLASGMNLAFVSKLLGHSTIAITADIYGHLDPGVAREGMEKLAAAMA